MTAQQIINRALGLSAYSSERELAKAKRDLEHLGDFITSADLVELWYDARRHVVLAQAGQALIGQTARMA